MAPSSSLQPPSSSFGGGGRRNPLTSGGAQPPATSSIPMLDSESSVRRRIAEGTDFGLSEAGVSQAGGSDLGTMNEARTRAARTTGEEVQEERTRRLRDQLGIAAREGRSKIRDDAAESFQTVFEHFLSTFEDVAAAQEDTQDEFGARVYARQLGRMRVDECATVFVDFGHVMQHDERAAQALVENYLRLEPYMGRAARRAYQKARRGLRADEGAMQGAGENLAIAVALFGLPATQRVRELRADKIGTLASVGGTVTRTSEVRPELVRGVFRCGACSGVSGAVTQQFKYTEPSICENALCQNRTAWTLVVEQSVFADWQRVRVQEHAAEIPPGSMPRTLDVVVRGDLVERVKPGDRALFTGALVALPDVSQLAGPGQTAEAQRDSGRAQGGGGGGVTGVQALGVRELTYRLAFVACHAQAAGADAAETGDAGDVGDARDAFLASLTRAEREELAAMGAGGDVYSRLAASIAPTVFGHDEVKRGILLQLLGGVHKRTREGMRLRGDINVCVVGDPSTAKSQFLKYVAGLLPRAVFTSGKASSAAGLTASVVRDDETGDFTVEAGALMLADHGVCCIDEFDKMDIADQVAIHEAMEQQTISIAKAGIHATLNARTSILAAATP